MSATQTKEFADMTVREMVDGIGREIMTQEVNGDILIGTLKTVNCAEDWTTVKSLNVTANGTEVVWEPAQWIHAVFV